MYITRDVKPGYNTYLSLDVREGEGSLMDVGLLVLAAGEAYTFCEPEKEVSFILMRGQATAAFDDQTVLMNRPNPFDFKPWCLLMAPKNSCTVTAQADCEFYVQKTYGDQDYATVLYTPDDIHTWHRGAGNELDGCMERLVRTCYDYESRPDSNMVLGEVVSFAGRWSSYPPHHHPQPEVYFYFFERPEGFGAGWSDGRVYQIGHHGCSVVTDDYNHPQVMAPGYPCCYVWGIRHLPGNPWEKTRIDDPTYKFVLDDPQYWRAPSSS